MLGPATRLLMAFFIPVDHTLLSDPLYTLFIFVAHLSLTFSNCESTKTSDIKDGEEFSPIRGKNRIMMFAPYLKVNSFALEIYNKVKIS